MMEDLEKFYSEKPNFFPRRNVYRNAGIKKTPTEMVGISAGLESSIGSVVVNGNGLVFRGAHDALRANITLGEVALIERCDDDASGR